jgi:hypothetical protein
MSTEPQLDLASRLGALNRTWPGIGAIGTELHLAGIGAIDIEARLTWDRNNGH